MPVLIETFICRADNYGYLVHDIESRRKVPDPPLSLREAQDRHGRGHIYPRCIRNTERLSEAGPLDGVALPDLHLGGEVRPRGVAHERAHAAAAAEELVEEVRADVAGSTREQDRFRVHRARYVPGTRRDDPAPGVVRNGGQRPSVVERNVQPMVNMT